MQTLRIMWKLWTRRIEFEIRRKLHRNIDPKLTGILQLEMHNHIRRIQSIKSGQEVVGNRTRIRVVKNKVAPPFRTVEFDIMYNESVSKAGDLIDLAVEMDIVEKKGSFYSYKGARLAQGREKSKEHLQKNPGLYKEIET